MVFSPDGTRLFTGFHRGFGIVWDVRRVRKGQRKRKNEGDYSLITTARGSASMLTRSPSRAYRGEARPRRQNWYAGGGRGMHEARCRALGAGVFRRSPRRAKMNVRVVRLAAVINLADAKEQP